MYGESKDTITFDLERSSQGYSDFEVLYVVKEQS